MIRIKINPDDKSSVINMTARGGWKVTIFRDSNDSKRDFVTVLREPVRFHLHIEGETVVLDRYVDGKRIDTKKFYDTGSGINGTICISENPQANTIYGYFRTDELQTIIEDFELKRIEIAKEPGKTMTKTIAGNGSTVPPFHTDGTYEEQKAPDGSQQWLVGGATWIWEYETRTLHIPQIYDHERIYDALEEIVTN